MRTLSSPLTQSKTGIETAPAPSDLAVSQASSCSRLHPGVYGFYERRTSGAPQYVHATRACTRRLAALWPHCTGTSSLEAVPGAADLDEIGVARSLAVGYLPAGPDIGCFTGPPLCGMIIDHVSLEDCMS